MTTESTLDDSFVFEGKGFRKLRLNCGLPVQRVETYVHDALCEGYVIDDPVGINFFQTESARDEAIKHQYYVKDVEKIEFRGLFGIKWNWDVPDYL